MFILDKLFNLYCWDDRPLHQYITLAAGRWDGGHWGGGGFKFPVSGTSSVIA